MKKLSLLSLIGLMLVFISCNDGGSEGPKNEIVIDGNALPILGGYYDDYGTAYHGPPLRAEGQVDPTHKITGFAVTDGTWGVEDEWPSDYNFAVSMALYSPGAEGFTTGTFTMTGDQVTGDQTGNRFGYGYADWVSAYGWVTDGTVTISGSFPDDLRFDFDVTVGYYNATGRENGNGFDGTANVSGFFRGTFEERIID